MVYSAEVILTLYGIAVFAVLRRSHRRRKPIRSKDIISEQILIPTTDMISELPDDILISIISRMRNKESTRTSILSKRWRNLYKFVPDFELRCCDLFVDCPCSSSCDVPRGPSNLIVEAVDNFFRLRSGSDKIRSFRYRCCLSKLSTDRFESWIPSLGRMGVEELVLEFFCRSRDVRNVSFSYSLVYEMPSLRYSKLALCSLQPTMGKTQLCKSLQILILKFVTVAPGALDCILSTCLNLHTLSINCCHFEPASKLSISGPNLRLKSLYIFDCSASNLVTFEVTSYVLVTFIFDHVPRLQSIYLAPCSFISCPYVWGELAKDLPQLKSLAFRTASDYLNMYEIPVGINIFRNLRQLDLSFYWDTRVNLLSLIPFLQSCPDLQEFHLDTSDMTYTGPRVEKQAILFDSQLKKVELTGFHGTENELEFALYMLKSAVGLELMHIGRCAKLYMRYGSWRQNENDESKWSRWTHRMIQRRLRGQAVSKTARVVIQYESLSEEDKWGRSGGCHRQDIETLWKKVKVVIK